MHIETKKLKTVWFKMKSKSFFLPRTANSIPHRQHFFFLSFLGPYPWCMDVPRQEVKLELYLPAIATATATRDPSQICDIHHSSRQCRIPNLLWEARNQTCIIMDTSPCATTGTPNNNLLIPFLALALLQFTFIIFQITRTI